MVVASGVDRIETRHDLILSPQEGQLVPFYAVIAGAPPHSGYLPFKFHDRFAARFSSQC